MNDRFIDALWEYCMTGLWFFMASCLFRRYCRRYGSGLRRHGKICFADDVHRAEMSALAGKGCASITGFRPWTTNFSLERLKLRGLTDGEVVNVHYPNPETLHCSDGGFSYHRDYRWVVSRWDQQLVSPISRIRLTLLTSWREDLDKGLKPRNPVCWI